jgi:hypothetical protein
MFTVKIKGKAKFVGEYLVVFVIHVTFEVKMERGCVKFYSNLKGCVE